MKILLVSSAPKEGGSTLRALYIAKYLRKEGNDVYLIKPIRTYPFFLDYAISLPLYSIKSILKDCDVAMAMKPYPNAAIPVFLNKIRGSKAVIDIDDVDYGYRKNFMSSAIRAIQYPFPKRGDLITYHNDCLYKHISKNFGVLDEKMYKLDQGVDLDIFNPLASFDRETIEKLHVNINLKDGYVIVYTASLNIACGLDCILYALKSVISRNPDIKLLVVGGGVLLKYYKDLVAKMKLRNNVFFTGYVELHEVPKYINIANTCIVYYSDKKVNYYRVSMKLREYLAMGKKVVCNDVGDLKLFEEYTYQTSSNLKDFAQKIVDVVEQEPDKRVRSGQKFVKNNYSWVGIGRGFNKKLESIVN
jgi:glycosyltransferase involved in cell wall biosynthesis